MREHEELEQNEIDDFDPTAYDDLLAEEEYLYALPDTGEINYVDLDEEIDWQEL